MATFIDSLLDTEECLTEEEANALLVLYKKKEKLPPEEKKKYIEYIWSHDSNFSSEIGEILKSLPNVKIAPLDKARTGEGLGSITKEFRRVYLPLKYFFAFRDFFRF